MYLYLKIHGINCLDSQLVTVSYLPGNTTTTKPRNVMFLVLELVKLPSVKNILFHFHKFKMATSKMAISKMAFHFCIGSKHHFVSVFKLDQPLYWKVTKIILDSPPGSHLESIVV